MAQKRSTRSAPDAPSAAASYVRRGAQAIRARNQGIGKQISLAQAERFALCQWAEINGKQIPFKFVEQFKPIGSGAEHRVYLDEQNSLAVKATHRNSFGHSVFARDVLATPCDLLAATCI